MPLDLARVAMLRYNNSVGQSRMRWLGTDAPHHQLSHEPNDKTEAQNAIEDRRFKAWSADFADCADELHSNLRHLRNLRTHLLSILPFLAWRGG